MILGTVNGQRLTVQAAPMAGDSLKYLSARFTFSDDWDGTTRYVSFEKNAERCEMELDSDNEIKASAGLNLSAGQWMVGVYGNIFDPDDPTLLVKRITTSTAILEVAPSGAVGGEPFPATVASLGEKEIEEAKEAAREAVEAAESAGQSAQAAGQSSYNAGQSAQSASEAAEDAEAWAVGTKDGEDVPSTAPQYENHAKHWAGQAENHAEDAEAWAVGTKDGVPVSSGAPQYDNHAKHWAGQAEGSAALAEYWASWGEANILDLYPRKTVTGDPVEITDGADGLEVKGLQAAIRPAQSGADVPTPSAPRPVVPWTQIQIERYGVDTSDHLVSVTVALGREVYGGTLDLTTGVLSVTHVRLRVVQGQTPGTNLVWDVATTPSGNRILIALSPSSTTSAAWPADNDVIPDGFICTHFGSKSFNGAAAENTIGAGMLNGQRYLAVGMKSGDDVTGSPQALKNYLSDFTNTVYLVFPRTTPQTYSLTAQDMTTLLGTNHFVCDAGAVTVEYRMDPTLAYNELAAAIVAAAGTD